MVKFIKDKKENKKTKHIILRFLNKGITHLWKSQRISVICNIIM